MSTVRAGLVMAVLTAGLPVVAALTPSQLPVVEGFEGLANGTPLTQLETRGWGASDGSVQVQTNTVVSGTNALVVPVMQVASNLVGTVAVTNVWTDFMLNEAQHTPADMPVSVDTNLTVSLRLDTNGYVTVYDPAMSAWRVCTNDYWGTNTAAFYTGGVARVSVLQNYVTHQTAVFLNGHLLLDGLAFINTNQSRYATVRFNSGTDSPLYLDDIALATTIPAGLTNDLDRDGMSEAQELMTYGDVTTYHRPVVTLHAMVGGTISPSNTFDVFPGANTNVFALQADPGYCVYSVQTNNGLAMTPAGTTRFASYTLSNTWSDVAVLCVFSNTARRVVPDDYATLQAALDAAQPGDTIVVPTGGVYTATTANLAVGSSLVVSNSALVLGAVTMASGATIRVTNGSATIGGTILTGTFTLDWTWSAGGITPAPLPFADDFERYGNGLTVSALGTFGWGAASLAEIVQSNVVHAGNRAVQIPVSASVSNLIDSAGATHVWTDVQVNPQALMPDDYVPAVDSNLTVMAYLNTSGFLVVYDRRVGWIVCSNDPWGHSTAGVYTGGWTRLSVFQDYGTTQAAFFVNGHLVREQVPLISTNQSTYASWRLRNGTDGSTYLDDVSVSTSWPASLTLNVDHDGLPDAQEIDLIGTAVPFYPFGTVFKLR